MCLAGIAAADVKILQGRLNEPVAEDFEVSARELDEVDDNGTGLLAGADGEVSRHVGGEGAGASVSVSVSASASASCGFQRRWVRL